MQVTLPIFHHNDKTDTLKDCGIDYNLSDTEQRDVTFFSINAISSYYEDYESNLGNIKQREYTSIHSNGSEYICSYPIHVVLEKINGVK
jgi:hypothetical protein